MVQEENILISDHYEIHMVIIYITPDIALYKKNAIRYLHTSPGKSHKTGKGGLIVHSETKFLWSYTDNLTTYIMELT